MAETITPTTSGYYQCFLLTAWKLCKNRKQKSPNRLNKQSDSLAEQFIKGRWERIMFLTDIWKFIVFWSFWTQFTWLSLKQWSISVTVASRSGDWKINKRAKNSKSWNVVYGSLDIFIRSYLQQVALNCWWRKYNNVITVFS